MNSVRGNRYLLDTHVFLWAIAAPERLSGAALEVVEDTENEIFVSVATAWEIATKWRIGKLPGAETIVRGFAAHARSLDAKILPVLADHALLGGTLEWDHRDPFDRLLAAQAQLEACTLLTADEAFSALNGVRTSWN